jgi:hypothetical protein
MAHRRNLQKSELSIEKFNIFVRFMIIAAEKKRFVEYNELNKVFGIPLEDLRDYAGFLGDYCCAENIPYLNSLIINTTEGMPGEDFFTWAEDKDIKNWGEYVAECFANFHIPISNTVRFQNTSGINSSISQFLND